MQVYSDTIIYIFCPPDKVTGGPEALHQLRYYMESLGYNAQMIYYYSNKMTPPSLSAIQS